MIPACLIKCSIFLVFGLSLKPKQEWNFQEIGGLVTRNTCFCVYLKRMPNFTGFHKKSFLHVIAVCIILSWFGFVLHQLCSKSFNTVLKSKKSSWEWGQHCNFPHLEKTRSQYENCNLFYIATLCKISSTDEITLLGISIDNKLQSWSQYVRKISNLGGQIAKCLVSLQELRLTQ